MPYSSQASFDLVATVDQVWDAITKPEIVKQYFFGTNMVTDWEVGHPIFFRGEWQGKAYEDKGTVLVFEPKTRLSYSYWSGMSGTDDAPENYQTITLSLEPHEHMVRLTIEQANVPTQENADHSIENWKMVFNGLQALLTGPAKE
jgi:uncharacterized protein YndB with AHSA1/START domain